MGTSELEVEEAKAKQLHPPLWTMRQLDVLTADRLRGRRRLRLRRQRENDRGRIRCAVWTLEEEMKHAICKLLYRLAYWLEDVADGIDYKVEGGE